MLQGETRCRKHCESRHQQFGSAFEIGDAIAVPALKEVVINIQSEIIQALNLARAVENAVLDFTALHESSVTGRKDATRAMDQLCQRISASMQLETKSHRASVEAPSPSASSLLSSYANMQPSDGHERHDKSLPLIPFAVDSPPSSILQRKPLNRTFPVRQHIAALQTSQKSGSLPSPEIWALKANNSQGQQADDESLNYQPISHLGQEEGLGRLNDLELKGTSKDSIRDSGLGSDRGSEHLHIMKTASMAKSIEPERGGLVEISLNQHPPPSMSPPEPKPATFVPTLPMADAEKHENGPGTPDIALHTSDASPSSSLTPIPLSARISRIEKTEDMLRALEAPEVVVSKDFGVMFSMRPVASSPTSPADGSDKYLAFRTQSDYAEALFSLSPGMNNIWAPLSRPAMHNRYHGFCKGAWQMRKAVSTCGPYLNSSFRLLTLHVMKVHEGLEVQITAALKEPIIHWACKVCKFRSKAPHEDALPDQIHFNQKYGIRYRWLFLAKSHCRAEISS